jgi:O-antigen ligase
MDAVDARPAEAIDRWLFASLLVWVIGVQTSEAIASAGMAMCLTGALVAFMRARPVVRVREASGRWAWVCAFIAWALLASSLAGRPPSGSGFARILDWAGVPLAAWAFARLSPVAVRRLVIAAGVALVLSSVIAGLQHFGRWPAEPAFGPFAFTRIPFHRVYELVPGTTDRYMGGGLLFHRLKFAHVESFAVLAMIAAGLHAHGRARACAIAGAVIGFVAILVFPYARAAAVALFVAMIFVVLLSVRRRALAFGISAAMFGVVLVVLLAVPGLRARFASVLTVEGRGDRADLLAAGVRAVETYPIAGTGAGRFQSGAWARRDAPAYVLDQKGKAHNQLLSIAAEVGLPGAVLFFLMLVSLARRIRLGSAEGAFAAGALAFFVLLGLVHDPLFQAPVSMSIVLALGIGAARRPDGWSPSP